MFYFLRNRVHTFFYHLEKSTKNTFNIIKHLAVGNG